MSKLTELLALWRSNPVLGIKQLFSVTPTKQQEELILAAWHPTARVAASSCQGAGKTACLVWLTFLFLLTQDDCQILITSPSYQQLTRVYQAQVAKWHHKMPKILQDQFIITKERISLKGREGFQFASLVTASAEHTENLQGGHAESYVILADEASGIEEAVFDLLLGTLSTHKGGRFIMTSNPLRASGRFYEVFIRDLSQWKTLYFSAYDSPVINKEWIAEMLETYGEDSDIFRVRVLGRFPRASNTQFFHSDIVSRAMTNEVPRGVYCAYPLIAGIDIARFGDDKTVFLLRQGPKLLHIKQYSGLSTMEVTGKLVDFYQKWKPMRINIDSIGIGAGVYDRAKELGLPVHGVIVSQKSTDPMQYLNLRSQLYGLTKQWLDNGADIPNDNELQRQLLSIEYGYNKKMQIQMMGKKEIKAKGLDSPDTIDALSYTFAGEAISRRAISIGPRKIKQSNFLWV
jgi:hypothetical protein